MNVSSLCRAIGLGAIFVAGCGLLDEERSDSDGGSASAGEGGEATGGTGVGGTFAGSGGSSGGRPGGSSPGGAGSGGRAGGAGSGAAGGAGGTGGAPPFPPMGGSAPPLTWKEPDVRTDPGGRYPDIMPDGMDGLYVVAHGNPAYLFDYTPSGWSATALEYASSVGSPQIAGNPESPFIEWRRSSDMQVTTFDGEMFGPVVTLGTLPTTPSDMELLASAETGTAVVFHTDDTNVYAYDFDGTTWSDRQTIGTGPNDGIARVARGTMDAMGRAAVIWQQQDGLNGFNDREAAGALFDGTSWQPAEVLGDPGSDTFQGVGFVDVDVNAAGQGFAVWAADRLWVMPVDLAVGWAEPFTIDPDTRWLEDWPVVAVNEAGAAVLAWYEQEVNVFDPHLVASVYTPVSGWSAPQELMSDVSPETRVAIDESGRAVVAWVGPSGSGSGVFAAHYTPSGGWGRTVRVTFSTLRLTGPEVSIQGDTASIVWAEADVDVTVERLVASTATLPT